MPLLDELLARDVAEVAAEERATFDRLAGTRAARVVLFGAGGMGRRVLAAMRHDGAEPLAFADNDTRKWRTRIDGVDVLSPAAAAERFGTEATFVVSIWGANSPHRFRHSRKQLQDLGCDLVVPFAPLLWRHDTGLPHYLQDLPHKVLLQRDEVRRAAEIWADADSRREYEAQVRFRLLGDFEAPGGPVPGRPYLRPELWEALPEEYFVDCGAYDGDTLRDFLALRGERFGRIDALEPDGVNVARLQSMVDGLTQDVANRVHVHPVAVGDHEGVVDFAATGTASSASVTAPAAEGTRVRCARLDDLLGGTVPTLIKMDVEGAELDALRGAQHLVVSGRPVLAICVYHTQDHLWRIPLWIRDLGLGYRLHLRSHNEEGFDLVCYAVPEGRAPTSSGA